MTRKNILAILSLVGFILVGCHRAPDPEDEQQLKAAPQTQPVTAAAETQPVAEVTQPETSNPITIVRRGIIVRRAETYTNGSTRTLLMLETVGPNDEKTYPLFSSELVSYAALAEVGDQVEVTWTSYHGQYQLKTFDFVAPKLTDAK